MEIIESNKLIAEFMQIPKCKRCDDCGSHQYGPSITFHPSEMHYQDRWDWLMPVVEKIRADCNYLISIRFNRKLFTTTTTIACFENKWHKDLEHHGEGITSVYAAVISFIQWHKDNSK